MVPYRTVMFRIADPHHVNSDLDPKLHFETPGLHCERYGPSRLYFKYIKLQNFNCNADPERDPSVHFNADPDSASHRIRIRNPGHVGNLVRVGDIAANALPSPH